MPKERVFIMMKKNKNLFCNLFLAPAVILYTGFLVLAIGLTIYYSFLDWNGLGKAAFDGLTNYKRMFRDNMFWNTVKNTLIFIVLAVTLQNVLGIILAYAVSRIKKGYSFFRAVFFLPVILTSAAIAQMFVLFFSQGGPVNWMLGLEKAWLSDPKTVLYCIIFPEVWQYVGTYFLIHLTGIQGIPEDVIESARLDGASTPRILVQVILPMMSEVIQVGILFSLINAVKSFNYSWLMAYGGPGTSSSYVSVYMYKTIFQNYEYGYGSALAAFMLLVLVVVTFLVKTIFNKKAES